MNKLHSEKRSAICVSNVGKGPLLNMNENKEQEIDLLELIGVLWKNLFGIVIATVLGAVLVLIYTVCFVTPKYQASAMLFVNTSSLDVGSTKINLSDLTASKSLANTYSVILKSRTTLEEVIEKAGLDYNYTQLGSMITTATVDNTEVFRVIVTSDDPNEAKKIANTIVEVLPERIKDIMDGSAVKVVDDAIAPKSYVSPSYKRNALIGALIGFVIACAIVIIRYMLDTTIHSESFLLEEYENIPLLSVVPVVSDNGEG